MWVGGTTLRDSPEEEPVPGSQSPSPVPTPESSSVCFAPRVRALGRWGRQPGPRVTQSRACAALQTAHLTLSSQPPGWMSDVHAGRTTGVLLRARKELLLVLSRGERPSSPGLGIGHRGLHSALRPVGILEAGPPLSSRPQGPPCCPGPLPLSSVRATVLPTGPSSAHDGSLGSDATAGGGIPLLPWGLGPAQNQSTSCGPTGPQRLPAPDLVLRKWAGQGCPQGPACLSGAGQSLELPCHPFLPPLPTSHSGQTGLQRGPGSPGQR